MKSIRQNICLLIIHTFLFISCTRNNDENALFTVRDDQYTGLHFVNKLTADPAFNLFSYMYYYNGAGVGAGDFNNDGLIDLFFAANRTGSALYINKGKLKFEDVTAKAGIQNDNGWNTGVSVVDINADGMLDIYVCQVGNYKILKGKNRLLICKKIDENGIPHYEDEAAAYGLDFSGYSTQAAFLDYDKDGDLDMFLLNHSVNHDGNYAPRANFEGQYDTLVGQRLYRNDQIRYGNQVKINFTDVTKLTGIRGTKIGYGLGVAVADINLDGWPDLYIGNDFHENDYLYINQKNGTFKDQSTAQLMHTSQFSMGVDVADVNNDAFPEIISMDMLPYDPYMLRRSLSEDDYTIFQQKSLYGYHYQYARNNFQLNQRNGRFSEIGQFAGVFATDWSWAALWMDFNNDGNKDLFVSNGIPKRMNDIDYINYVSGEELQQKLRNNGIQEKDLSLIEKFPEIKLPNQFFISNGGLKFENISGDISKNPLTFSNGAVYADLDNDGDLDIVVNNINDPVVLYENNCNSEKIKTDYARVDLKDFPSDPHAFGTKIILFDRQNKYTYEKQSVHGFQSSMLGPVHIGLKNINIDSAFVIWPNDKYQRISINKNTINKIEYNPTLTDFNYALLHVSPVEDLDVLLEDITESTAVNHTHVENPFNEFDREPLIPHMVSAEGPAIAVEDINHDGREDFFIGSSKSLPAALYLQTPQGKFTQYHPAAIALDSMWEHVDATWGDVNNDTHPDLIIATGGNEYYGDDEHLKPLLYLNDGKGNLSKQSNAFPNINVTQSSVVKIDLNHDGYLDLFISGRAIPWEYGISPRSYLLLNNKNATFSDVTISYCKDLLKPGMITSASASDLNKDGQDDLLLSYDWGGVEIFLRKGNGFEKKIVTDKKGWWQFSTSIDIDDDGDMDIIAGNFGLNSRLKSSDEKPVSLYINDFDGNGRVEQVMTYYVGNEEIPFASKILLEKSMPFLKKKFLYAEDFAKATIPTLLGKEKLNKSLKLTASYFGNAVFINDGKLNFTLKELPASAQYSTYKTATKIDHQIMLFGNYFYNNVEIGRQDADYGVMVSSSKQILKAKQLNVLVNGQVRKTAPIKIKNRQAYILAKNNAALQIISKK
ncbi:MAG: VCBS repeat-containing protein [Chitinophagaceae bacterium]